jgi:hypothetical protein
MTKQEETVDFYLSSEFLCTLWNSKIEGRLKLFENRRLKKNLDASEL